MRISKGLKLVSVDNIIWALTVLQFSFIYIYESSSRGVVYMAIISIIICLLAAYKNNGRVSFSIEPFHMFVLSFSAFSLVSSLWAWNRTYAIEKGVTILEILICFSLVYFYYRQKDAVKTLIDAIMWGCYVVIGYSIASLGWNSVMAAIRSAGRLNAEFTNINSLGMISALAIVITVYKIQQEGLNLWNFIMVPTVIVIAASGSRKALVLVVLGVALLYITRVTSSNKNIMLKGIRIVAVSFTILLIIRVFSSLSLFSGINTRMEGLFALITGRGVVDHSAFIRQRMIEIGWDQFLKTPIIGIGMGNARIMTSVLGYDSYLHNNYIELLANGGIVGFSIYYSIYIYIIYNIIRYRKPEDYESMLCLIIVICLLVTDFGSVSYYSKSTYYYFMVFFIEISLLKERKKLERNGETDNEFISKGN